MSNAAVGALYKRIMDQVIEISRTDFEENGVDNRMVTMLQEKWQMHLTSKRSASFPWDPAIQPEPQPEPSAPTAKAAPPTSSNAPSSTSTTQAQAQPQPQSQQTSPVSVKQEPGYDNSFSNYPASNNAYSSNPDVAAQRAQHLVQARYQNQAQQQGMNLGNIQLPAQQAAQQRPGYTYQNQSYQQQRSSQPSQGFQQSSQQQQNGAAQPIKQENHDSIGSGQVDGASDEPAIDPQWSAVIANRHTAESNGGQGRVVVDHMIRKHVARQMRRLEAGGLLVPLDDRYPSAPRPKPRSSKSATSSSLVGPSRYDGGDEEDEEDVKSKVERHEDDINSDLDDSEDDAGDAMVGEDYVGDMIICLYDKVQRVKNKWKCTLKDGVVNVDGKDYVFHRATGEFEW